MDIAKPKGFKQYDVMDENFLKNIMIKVDKKQIRALGAIRQNVPYTTQRHFRFYFETDAAKSSAERIWKKL
jgi:hypothetical protein